jgi:NarL family two-component system response regulator LiaR
VTRATRRTIHGHGETGKGPLRMAIANDYDVIVQGLRRMLEPYRDRIEVVELDVDQDPGRHVDVVLFDTYGAGRLGLERVRSLASDQLVGAVVVYTWGITDAGRELVIGAGASAVVAKALSAPRLVDAIEAVGGGNVVKADGFELSGVRAQPGGQWGLRDREREILALLSTGMSNRDIADSLFLSENTVRSHLKSVFRKLGVSNRSQAVAFAMIDLRFAMEPPA